MPGFNYGGGVGDGTNWSSERGETPSPGGGSRGNAGNRDNSSTGVKVSILKRGDRYMTPWGEIVVNNEDHAVMNGTVMTYENSSMVADPTTGGYTRILNTLAKTPPKTTSGNNKNKTPAQINVENYLAGGSWAGSGPLDKTVINAAIGEAIDKRLPRGSIPATSTHSYQVMRKAFNVKPISQQPECRAQIISSWQRAHDIMPNRVRTTHETGGKNGRTITGTMDNPAKKLMALAIPQVIDDTLKSLQQNQAAEQRRKAAEAKAKAEAAAKAEAERKRKAEAEAKKKEEDAVKDAVSKVADFYKELTSKYGEKLAKEAKELATDAKGKKLRSAAEAIQAFDKYKDSINKKFSMKDREAIAKALESLSKDQMAKQLATFSKAFGLVADAIQWSGFVNGLIKGFRTGNWDDAIINGESIVASKLATALIAVAFSSMAVAPIGIIGFAIIMAIVGALITEDRLKKMNEFVMSL
ncbi:TPA: hypothetical protein SLG40_003818 [Serratia odorifera]|nr:hypothetical protein [Serratia odorifera]